jgi:hypothetical protein
VLRPPYSVSALHPCKTGDMHYNFTGYVEMLWRPQRHMEGREFVTDPEKKGKRVMPKNY